MKRIVVTGDFLRAEARGRFTQGKNIRWFYHLLAPLWRLLGQNRIMFVEGTHDKDNIAAQFYAAVGRMPQLESWTALYDSKCDPRQQALLTASFSDALVVSFELPEIIAHGFTAAGIPYIDFAIHPCRFANELYFGARSNLRGIDNALKKWQLEDEIVALEAGWAQAALAHFTPQEKMAQGGAALFVCQTPIDRSLIHDGRIVRIADFLPELAAISDAHDVVLVKPHPYGLDNEQLTLMGARIKNMRMTTENIYYLLTLDSIDAIYSLSSGVTREASYFGKKARNFMPIRYEFSATSACGHDYLPIQACFLNANFWKMVFEQSDIPYEDRNVSCAPLDLRQSLGQWWGAYALWRKCPYNHKGGENNVFIQ